MKIIFDGKGYAELVKNELAEQVFNLRKKGVFPNIAVLLAGDDHASEIYVGLKKKVAHELGIDFSLYRFSESNTLADIRTCIDWLNQDESVHGIVIQLPLPSNLQPETESLISMIDSKKDVDGQLGEKSPYLPATVQAVVSIIDRAPMPEWSPLVCVVGAKGIVGSGLMRALPRLGYECVGVDVSKTDNSKIIKTADIVISATGVAGLIKSNMVKDDVIIIDVGSPIAEVDFKEVSKKSSFITPVPGGVGPVTVVSLMQNLVKACGLLDQ